MAKKMMKKKAAGAAGAKHGGETLIVGSKVKAAIKEHGCMTSGELLEALNARVHEVISRACERAQQNKRSTVRSHDV